jgi:DNA polymerase phi
MMQEKNLVIGAEANKLHAMRYLLIQLLLQVLLRPGEFSEAASELIICCKKAFAASDLLDSSGEEELDNDADPKLMDVLVDTFLSLLPQSSAPMRSAIEQVCVVMEGLVLYLYLHMYVAYLYVSTLIWLYNAHL